jgi:hypothetical protein
VWDLGKAAEVARGGAGSCAAAHRLAGLCASGSADCRPRITVDVGDCRSPGVATTAEGKSLQSGRAAPAAAPSRPRDSGGGSAAAGGSRLENLFHLQLGLTEGAGVGLPRGHKVNKHCSLACHD